MDHGDPSQEVKNALLSNITLASMANESYKHDVLRLLSELPVEHLLVLGVTFSLLQLEDGPMYAAHLGGLVAGTLLYKHNICPACGKDHDKELLDPEAIPVHDSKAKDMPSTELEWMAYCVKYNVTARLQLKEYPLKELLDTKVRCKNCGQEFVNLKDRMLKPPGPEGCQGCIQKAKWG